MEYYNSLVAGHDDPGFQDGAFDDAYFSRPQGLAFDTEGKRLFVADEDNHRIRVIYPEEGNRVETLAGSGVEGSLDGTLVTAQFKQPVSLAYLPNDQLAVFDIADGAVRLIDIPQKQVTTLVSGGIVDGYSMVYWPVDGRLYISDEALGKILRLDLKTKGLLPLFYKDARLSEPKALCVYHNKIYVSDGKADAVYGIDIHFNEHSEFVGADLQLVSQKTNVVAMAVSNDHLYAVQTGNSPLVQLFPDIKPVKLATVWGFLQDNSSSAYTPFLSVDSDRSIGFVASPNEPRKFYITQRIINTNSIVSVKDYGFEEAWPARSKAEAKKSLSDFDYPEKKPSHTFRILIAGNSMLVTAPTAFTDKEAAVHDENSLLSHTLSKQLEFLLNAEGAWQNVPEHFEVLNLGRPSGSLVDYGSAEIPELAKKYDVDLVIDFVTPYEEEQFRYYYEEPLTSQGIPSGDIDPEFLLKPWAQRIPAGAPGDLFQRAEVKKWASINKKGQVEFNKNFQELLLAHDADIRMDLQEMLGKPLQLLEGSLNSLKTSGGKTPQFIMCFVPSEGARPLKEYQSFGARSPRKTGSPLWTCLRNLMI